LRIHEVIIEVGDVEAAVAFSTEVVGMTHVRTVDSEHGAVAELDADGQRVSLVPSPAPTIRLALGTSSVRSRLRRLRTHKVTDHDPAPTEVDGGRWLGFTDPWGHRLGFWEHDEEPDGQG
jgi:catechol 2,3-dioxygenase-like lactoylglutathione lyase family enzyme